MLSTKSIIFNGFPRPLDETQCKRRQQLTERMKKINLHNYEKYLGKLAKDYEGDCLNEEDKTSLVMSFIQQGYPSLSEVVRTLAPAIRCQMLKDEDCWIKDDPRCVFFVKKSSEPSRDIASIKAEIFNEREIRKLQLEEEFEKRNLSIEIEQDCSYYLRLGAQDYIINGFGTASWIADAKAAEKRHKSLIVAYREAKLTLPKGLEYHDYIQFKHTEDSYKDAYKAKNNSCEDSIVEFILGDTSPITTAEDFVIQKCAEFAVQQKLVASRQEIINEQSAELLLDLDALTKFKYYKYQNQIKLFVEEGVGNGMSPVARIAFEERVKDLDFPDGDTLFRKNPSLEESFNTAALGTNIDLSNFITKLIEEREGRLTELQNLYESIMIDFISIYETKPEEREYIFGEEESMLRLTDYVQYGIGTVNHAAKTCQKTIRRKALQRSLEKAVPPLLLSNLSSRMKIDKRLDEFIEETSAFKCPSHLAAKLQCEEASRMKRVKIMLSNLDINLDALVSERIRRNRFSSDALCQYLLTGTGYCKDIADEVARCYRKKQLEDLLGWRNFSQLQLPLCKGFIEGRSHYSADEILSTLQATQEIRKEEVIKLLQGSGISREESQDTLKKPLEDTYMPYINGETSDINFIKDAINFSTRLVEAKSCFGRLGGMLPKDKFPISLKSVKCDVEEEHLTILEEKFCSLGYSEDLARQKMSPNGNVGIFPIIMSYVEPTFYNLVNYSNRDKDERIMQLLTNPKECIWDNAEQAVIALRNERKERIQKIDKEFSPDRLPKVESQWSICFLSNEKPLSTQDKEDDILNNHDARADYINGKVSLVESLERLYREEREVMLAKALSNACLHERLMRECEECIDFLEHHESKNPTEALSLLVSTLKHERSERCRLLDECFNRFGITDMGVGTSSTTEISIMEDLAAECRYYHEDLDFPSVEEVAKVRFEYVDLGIDGPSEVVEITIRFYRTEKLESAVKLISGFGADEIIRKSKKCKTFVGDIGKGIPSDEEVKTFVEEFFCDTKKGKKKSPHEAVPYDGGSDGKKSDDSDDDYNSDYDDMYGYDDDTYVDWKDALSGGDYGNNPDTDAMWDAYWDCWKR